MTKKLATRSVQYPAYAEFVWNFNDWVVDSATGAKVTLGSTQAASVDPQDTTITGAVANTITFDAIPMPIGAVITGGEMIVETAVTGSTAYTVSLGIAGTLTALLNAQSALSTGRTALTITAPLTSNAGQNLRATIAYTVANATAGRIRLRVQYTVDSKANEVLIA
jgi:hypothetical protein